jgi:hypothetical protein
VLLQHAWASWALNPIGSANGQLGNSDASLDSPVRSRKVSLRSRTVDSVAESRDHAREPSARRERAGLGEGKSVQASGREKMAEEIPDPDEEIRRLLEVMRDPERAPLRPPAMLGRLAELYLQRPGDERAAQALKLAERGLTMITRDDPLYPKLLHVVASALRAISAPPPGSLGHDGRAARLDRDAWLLSVDSNPADALQFAERWGDWAWCNEVWDEAGEAYQGASIAGHRIVLRSPPGILNRLELLSQQASLSLRSAFAYAQQQRSREAVTVLERAGDLLSGVDSQLEDLDRLAAMGRSDLCEQWQTAVAEAAAHAADPPDAYGRLAASRQQVQARADALARQIRAVPGMARFATPAGWADVSEAAQHQPVAYLAATDKGTVVLTVMPGARTIKRAIVPQTMEQIWAGVQEFFVSEYERGEGDPQAAILTALERIGQITAVVRESVADNRPVLLVPFGLLAQLPVHAGYAVFPADGSRAARMHFWFNPAHVSYASSARRWLACRARAGLQRGAGALVVNNPVPLPAALDELELSDFERDAVASHFPVTELAGRDATVDAILAALPGAAVAHLTCHGVIDRRERYTGVLIVAGQRVLTIQHLGFQSVSARLVFLAACTSGMSALGVAQLASVPSSLIAGGAAAVIATFWHADDMATLLVVSRFYDLWQDGSGRSVAEALGQAQAWLASSPASVLRAAVPSAALQTRAGQHLADCPDQEVPFGNPWFWTPFFVLGA